MLNHVAVHQDPFRSQNTVLLMLIKYKLPDLAVTLLSKFGDRLSSGMLNAEALCYLAPMTGVQTQSRAYYLSWKKGFHEVWQELERLNCDTQYRDSYSEDEDGEIEFSYWRNLSR